MLPITLRNALLSVAVLLPAHVLADDDDSSDVVTFQFSACVSTCLAETGYSMDGEDNQKDMCKASRDGLLLEAIMACMASQCLEDMSAVDANLLQPLQTGCKELEKPVSDDEIGDAASAAANIIQAAAATTTSITTTSPSSIGLVVTISAAPLSFEPLGVETETSTAPDLLTTPVPAVTPAAVEPPVETATSVSAESTAAGTSIYQPEAAVPAETHASTPEAATPSETPPAPEPATSAEASAMSAAAIVPVAQLTHVSVVQPTPEATTLAELAPSGPVPSPQPSPTSTSASASASASASDHANQIRPDTTLETTTPSTTSSTTIVKPTSTHEANAQGQQTTATGQAPDNSPVAGVATTSSSTTTEASKTEGSTPKATTQSDDEDDDDDSDTSSSSATPDISGELVLATGTPTASGFATSITAVAASPSASGSSSQTVAEDSDGGVGGGSPFSVVLASAASAAGWRDAWCVVVAAVVATLVSLMNL